MRRLLHPRCRLDCPGALPRGQSENLILEPCAGRGHMVYALRALGFTVRAADLYPYEAPLVPDITVGADVFDPDRVRRLSLSWCRICPTANRPPSSPISCRSRPVAGPMWRSWRDPNGARRRPAARSCTRMHGSPERCGSRNGPNGFARQSLLPPLVLLVRLVARASRDGARPFLRFSGPGRPPRCRAAAM